MNTVIEFRPEWFLLAYIAFSFLLKGFYPLAVFIHETGHALSALFLTRDRVGIRIGEEYGAWRIQLTRRLYLSLHFRQCHQGFCHYGKHRTQTHRKIVVACAGPLASAIAVCVGIALFFSPQLIGLGGRFLLIVFLYANLKILITSVLPIVYRDKESGKSFVSDGFDILTMIRG